MKTRHLNLALLLSVLTAALVGAYFFVGRRAGRHRAVDAVPASAWVVATLDADAVRASSAGSYLRDAAALLPPLTRLGEICGIDLLERTKEVAFALPEEGEKGDFGLSIRPDIGDAELARCAANQPSGTPSVTLTRHGSFFLVDAADAPPSEGQPRLAFRPGGPLVLSHGAWLESMLAAAEGRIPSVDANSEHGSLRAAVEGSAKDRAALVLSAVLPVKLRERLRAELREELGDAPRESGATMESLLGVKAIGVALALGTTKTDAELRGVLRCESTSACSIVATFLERERLGWSQDLRLRLLGLGPAIASFAVETKENEVRVRARLPANSFGDVVRRIGSLATRSRPPPPRVDPSSPIAPTAALPSFNNLPGHDVRPAARDAGPPGAPSTLP